MRDTEMDPHPPPAAEGDTATVMQAIAFMERLEGLTPDQREQLERIKEMVERRR
jgi:hypothetical protein